MTAHVDLRTDLERGITANLPALATPLGVHITDQNAETFARWLDANGVNRHDPGQALAVIAGFYLGVSAMAPPINVAETGAAILASTVDHRPEGSK